LTLKPFQQSLPPLDGGIVGELNARKTTRSLNEKRVCFIMQFQHKKRIR